jgi:Calcineurin-like phosphoesterase/Purple acid Phosphatase, N-terminal domain
MTSLPKPGAPHDGAFCKTTEHLVTESRCVKARCFKATIASLGLRLGLALLLASGAEGGAVTMSRGPYLQLATPTGIVVRWRTDVATNSRVGYGTSAGNLNLFTDESANVIDHEIALSGLTPGVRYFYAVGSTTTVLASGTDHFFDTPPAVGSSAPVRFWVLGDSGSANAGAAAVRDAFVEFSAGQTADALLMLGDNAYDNGTDAEFEAAVFDMYSAILRQTPLWPALGNHDTGGSTNPPASLPYFSIFTLPTSAEAGGAPSNTEKYYSFDLGNVHVVCLDSIASSRVAGSPMLTWLQADLAATEQPWVIAYWHHPPYSRGGNSSDTSTESTEMRQNVVPILEAGGVDLVLAGHSHNYERSFLIDGHYGTSESFLPSMKTDPANGSAGPYAKPPGSAPHAGAVYVVAGTGATLHPWADGSTALVNPNPHPAMAVSLRVLGSMVIDVVGERLEVRFVDSAGAVRDSFAISKAPGDYWRFLRFGTDAHTPTIAGDHADPDGDGLRNIFERAFATNPLVPRPSPVAGSAVGDFSALTFPRSLAATDLVFTVQASADLATWHDGSRYSSSGNTPSNAYTTEVTRVAGDPEQIIVRSNSPMSGSARGFLRLKIEAP